MNTVAVMAPGLLGGSILKALRAKSPGTRLKAYARREETRAFIAREKLADEVCADPAAAAADSDLVILCSPIGVMPEIVKQMLPALPTRAIVTDVGSVKAPVQHALAPLLAGKARWLGSHPMAGSEQSGIAAARADLFAGAVTVLTPTPETDADALRQLRAFWESLGGTALILSPAAHDDCVAQVSHLPHLLAALLVNTVAAADLRVAGPGFRDTTRVAAGPPEMWTDILRTNKQAVAAALKKFIAAAQQAGTALEQNDPAALSALLTAAAKTRRGI